MNPNQTLVAVCNAFKKLTFTLFFLFACSAFAQVGVGTQNPQATLHVAGANANANGTAPGALAAGDGVIVTRVTDDLSGENITTGCSAATRGALVYSTNDSGYYTCNGTNWVALGGRPDFTSTATLALDGSGGTATMMGNTANNIVEVTTAAFGAATQLTLPAPATNAGRIILVVNGPGGAAVQVTNSYSPSGSIGANSTRAFYCNGVTWFGAE